MQNSNTIIHSNKTYKKKNGIGKGIFFSSIYKGKPIAILTA